MKPTVTLPAFRSPRMWLGVLRRYLLLYVLFFIVRTGKWFVRTFDRVDLDQVLYHLQQSPEALVKADAAMVQDCISKCILAPLVYALLLLLLLECLGRLKRIYFTWPAQALAFTLATAWTVHATVVVRPPDFSGEDWLRANYAVPGQPEAPARKRNLVLVYVESMETAYRADALAGLPAKNNIAFDEFVQLPGTGWTIAGIVASQCALPLKPIGIFGHNALGESAPRFLPKARCLGDILKEAGYRNEFMGGAATQFAGKGRFLSQHGYDHVRGRDDWARELPGVTLNEWGLNDDTLFKQALERLRVLAASSQPFNLTVLTVGMHPPHGHLSPSCPARHQDFMDTVECTEYLVRQFVQSAQAEGLLANTDVLVMGDHLTMPIGETGRKLASAHRSVYNRMLTASPETPNRSEISHFDIAPTLLVALGFRLGDGRFGLGCAALGKVSCASMAQMPDAEKILQRQSAFYQSLWAASDRTEGQ